MAERHEVSCITKRDRPNPHECIQEIGGKGWTLKEEVAISGIENGTWQFYVHQGGRIVDVVVATHLGRKYLKTIADNYSPDNLLSLNSCPV